MDNGRHIYEYDIDPTSNTAPANVIRLVGENKRVLEVGCGPGSITKILTRKNRCRVTGFEIDLAAIEKVRPYCEAVLQVDLNMKDWQRQLDGVDRFDVVVAADVLEHLYDPWLVLKQIASLINENGYLVISLPHVGHAAIISCLLNGDFEYRDWGLLDRTHIRFFGLRNVEALFAQADLKIVEAKYVMTPPEETEFAESWARLPVQTRDVLKSCPHADVYQVVVKAVPFDRGGAAVPMIPPSVRRSSVSPVASLKALLGRHLSPRFKDMIRSGFGRLGIRF